MAKKSSAKTNDELLLENEDLRNRLTESEEALNAIRNGEVDAIIVSGRGGDKVFSLSSAETPYRIILEEMAEGAVIINNDGIIRYFNQRFADIFYDSSELVVGSNIIELISNDQKANFIKLIKKSHEGRANGIISHKSSLYYSPLYLNLSLRGLPSEVGADICILVSDITEIHQYQDHLEELVKERTLEIEKANNSLRESEERIRSILNNCLDIIYRIDIQTSKFDFISASAEKVMDMSPEALKQLDAENSLSQIHPDDLPAFQNAQKILHEKGFAEVEYRQLSKNGNYRWLSNHMSLTRDDTGHQLYRDGNIRDITERKKAEEALRNSEERFSKAFKNSPNAITITRLNDGKIIEGNDSVYTLLGYNQEEVIGKTTLELGIWADPADRLKLTRALASKGFIQNEDFVLRKKDGTPVPVNLSASLITIENQQCFLCSFIDLTERKKAEEALRKSEKRFRELVKHAPTAIYEIDFRNKRFISVNDAFCRMSGFTRDEALGTNILDLLSNESKNIFLNRISRCINGERPEENIEYEVIKKDGSLINAILNMTFNYNDEGNIVGAMVVGHDITERKKTEDSLKEAQKKLNIALENGNIGVWEWNLKTDEMIWDERMDKMLGLLPDILSKTFKDFESLINEEDLTHVQEAIRNTIEQDVPLETIFRIRSRNGEKSDLSLKAYVNKDKNSKPISLTGVCFDVTSLKEATESLILKLNEDLLRSNRELESFAYVASHDLQEPLRMVTSFTQLLEQQYKDKLDQKAQDYIHFAVDGSKRMYDLLNGLLDYSRIQSRGKEFIRVDLNHILEKVIKNLALQIRERNASIEIDELPIVIADESQMIQLFQNLITNSIKFSSETPVIYISFQSESVNHTVFVQDHGIGIEPQYFERIFKIFQRLNPREQYEGTGIGLAICKRIVERHGGRIWVESGNKRGSTFFFTLPNKNNV